MAKDSFRLKFQQLLGNKRSNESSVPASPMQQTSVEFAEFATGQSQFDHDSLKVCEKMLAWFCGSEGVCILHCERQSGAFLLLVLRPKRRIIIVEFKFIKGCLAE